MSWFEFIDFFLGLVSGSLITFTANHVYLKNKKAKNSSHINGDGNVNQGGSIVDGDQAGRDICKDK
ncbi:hypothetical protein [Halomonas elongata]|uniref:hypothetical protein n=1 Tax=Halomonas elongata TaxID=2746 RepID=UPI00186BAD1E|nr:hypothetical protein [Halomonas elongata]MBW5798616.1 hypothetical protein [Halomonas elongata]